MRIGTQYDDHKLYRGIRHYDHKPLTSGDMHEYYDIKDRKEELVYTNLFGNGLLNNPSLIIDHSEETEGGAGTQITLSSPLALVLEGDVMLVQSEDEYPGYEGPLPILNVHDIIQKGATSITDGSLCILGWYESIDYTSTIKSYGGIHNKERDNDLWNEELDLQPSTRYQFKWDLVIVSTSDLQNSSISVDYLGETLISTGKRSTSFYLPVPQSLQDVSQESRTYLVPLMMYHLNYAANTLTNIELYPKIKCSGGGTLVVSDEQPEHPENGDRWFDTSVHMFKTYVEDLDEYIGEEAVLVHESGVVVMQDNPSPSNVSVPIPEFQHDYMQGNFCVYYEGLRLNTSQYTIDEDNDAIILTSFITHAGDRVFMTLETLISSTTSVPSWESKLDATNPEFSGTLSGSKVSIGNNTESTGTNSIAFGNNTSATGNYSMTAGEGTIASHVNEVSFGKYNESKQNLLFSVGAGTTTSNRSNALEVFSNGKVYVNGIELDPTPVEVPTKLSDLEDDATHRLVTDMEKSTWSGKENAHTYVTGTLTAGQTSLTISSSAITDNQHLRVFTSKWKAMPTDVVATTGSVTLTFTAQTENIGVSIEVF